MYAAGFFRDGHVEAVIQENPRRPGRLRVRRRCGDAVERITCERSGIFSAQILFAKLNPIDARGGYRFDSFEKRLERILQRSGVQTPAVGYITEDELALRRGPRIDRGAIGEGHAKDPDANQ